MHHPSTTGHSTHDAHEGHSISDFQKRFWISLMITIPVLYFSDTVRTFIGLETLHHSNFIQYTLFILSSIVYVYGGLPFLRGMLHEIRSRVPGMMTLVAFAVTAAYLYSVAVTFGLEGMDFYWELVTLVDIMLLGHWIEMKTLHKASNALELLVNLMPIEAHRIEHNGSIIDVEISRLNLNDTVLVKPGEKVPSDGMVVDGTSFVNESLVSGESIPQLKKHGDRVIGGSLNGDGSLYVVIDRTGNDTFLAQVIALVREAQSSKSPTQLIAHRAAFWLTIIAISTSVLTLVGWMLFSDVTFAYALERAVTVMVISCPHALGLAIPLVVSVSTTLAARNGLLIRNRTAFENIRNVSTIILDKTGTLTRGEFGIIDTYYYTTQYSALQLLRFAASVESHSEHPIAQTIARSTSERSTVRDFRAIPGKGATGTVEDHVIEVVSPGYLQAHQIQIPQDAQRQMERGNTVVFLLVDTILSASFVMADMIRPESAEAIQQIISMNIHPVILSGDSNAVVRMVSDELAIKDWHAEVLPSEKSGHIKNMQQRGNIVAMVGDGVNDAPALAQADIGIAIGAGTDVAVESADIVLTRSNPNDIPALIRLARATYKKMIENLLWATGYNLIAIPLAAGVLHSYGIILSPAMGAILMSMSTIVVAINARLLSLR
jgi:Cu2+-exporting ATPase